MHKSNKSEVEFELKRLSFLLSDTFSYHQWPLEDLRWAELIVALLLKINTTHQSDIRSIVTSLHDLNLLSVKVLGEIKKIRDGSIDMNSATARQINKILSEYKFTEEESKKSILVMHEAALSLEKYHGGKMQKYLRKYGERMLDELAENFLFTKMSGNEVKDAFTFWLQNTVNMPLSLINKNFQEFCNKFGITPKELVEEADKLDLNVALIVYSK